MSGAGGSAERAGPVLVLGDGRSGRAAMALLDKLGRDAEQVADGLRELDSFGDLAASRFSEAVVSPGFPVDHPWLEALRAAAIPLVSEAEFGARFVRSKALAITGSLGKTTIVTAAVEILRAAGFSAEAVGNIGRPVCDLALCDEHPQWMVVEVSSFQLETMSRFAPEAAVVLNVVANHLDRHGDFQTYLDLKLKLLSLAGDAPVALGPVTAPVEDGLSPFGDGLSPFHSAIFDYKHGKLVPSIAGLTETIRLEGSIFDNPVLGTNAALLASVLVPLGIPQAAISEGFTAVVPLSHRVQELPPLLGVRYINDSKSTCVAATVGALRQVKPGEGHLLLLLGGRPKQHDFSELLPHLDPERTTVYAFGEAADDIVSALGQHVEVKSAATFDAVVRLVVAEARSGALVLLSPGCTSFDEFGSYAERGERFRTLLNEFETEKS